MTETSGPGSRGGDIPIRRTPPSGMPVSRWTRIASAVIDEDVEAALEKQERGEPLTVDERRLLVEANTMIQSEIDRWERGEPFDPAEANPEAQEPVDEAATPPSLAPPELPIGTPFNPDDMGDGSDPLSTAGIGRSVAARNASPDDMSLPSDPLSDAGIGRRLVEGAPRTTLGSTETTPPPTPSAPSTAPSARLPDTTAPAAPAPRPSAAAPKPSTPRPTTPPPSIGPPEPPPGPPPPRRATWEEDQGAPVEAGPLSQAVTRAGGRPTERTLGRVAGQVQDINRKGWTADTEGWATLANAAAAAWEEQYRTRPTSLLPSEVRAYEEDPDSLYERIMDANSPFRNYRESWIGAFREGQPVLHASEVDEQLRRIDPNYVSPFEATAPPRPAEGEPPTDEDLGLMSPTDERASDDVMARAPLAAPEPLGIPEIPLNLGAPEDDLSWMEETPARPEPVAAVVEEEYVEEEPYEEVAEEEPSYADEVAWEPDWSEEEVWV